VKPISYQTIQINGQPFDNEIDQIVYYQAGVGTQFGFLTKFQGDATGAGLKQNVREAYGFICHNWREGDEIYLFGFSRGAYTARAIAGLISQFGLLTSRGMDGFWAVMKDYIHGKFKYEPKRSATIEELARKYERHTPDKPIPIKFVGVFDTVRSIGLPKVYFFNHYVGCINRWIIAYDKKRVVEDTNLHPNIDFAYHAYQPIKRPANIDSLLMNVERPSNPVSGHWTPPSTTTRQWSKCGSLAFTVPSAEAIRIVDSPPSHCVGWLRRSKTAPILLWIWTTLPPVLVFLQRKSRVSSWTKYRVGGDALLGRNRTSDSIAWGVDGQGNRVDIATSRRVK
jgi:hypothetical protein